MPSTWAREDAITRYGLNPDRVFKVPFGANVEDPGPIVRRRASEPLRILTVGVKWHRKGCDKAVQAIDYLNANGVDARLDLVGATPPDRTWDRPYITYRGFLSKQNPADSRLLHSLYREADVFLLPTRNDPSPMVLGEAAAFALPVVAARVGGVPDRVHDGGLLLSEDASPVDYATAIRQVTNGTAYARFSEGARRDYLTRSSWDASAELAVRLTAKLSDDMAH
jgi:glycosyltransferase involved in cell wall biosynthesis